MAFAVRAGPVYYRPCIHMIVHLRVVKSLLFLPLALGVFWVCVQCGGQQHNEGAPVPAALYDQTQNAVSTECSLPGHTVSARHRMQTLVQKTARMEIRHRQTQQISITEHRGTELARQPYSGEEPNLPSSMRVIISAHLSVLSSFPVCCAPWACHCGAAAAAALQECCEQPVLRAHPVLLLGVDARHYPVGAVPSQGKQPASGSCGPAPGCPGQSLFKGPSESSLYQGEQPPLAF